MEKNEEKNTGTATGAEKDKSSGLPAAVENSPYLKYDNLEDYKRQGYGTEGHLEVKSNPGRGAAASADAPTLSVASSEEHKFAATDAIKSTPKEKE